MPPRVAKAAVIGGGINGVCSAWALAEHGYQVDLFERAELMGGTSSASSKLLHGGLRYLEYGELRLVRQALRERAWWLQHAGHLAHPLALLLPVRQDGRRPRALVKLGLLTYDLLSGRQRLRRHRWYHPAELSRLAPSLRQQGLKGAYSYWDGQMDDRRLGLWAAAQARAAGVGIHEHTAVNTVSTTGELLLSSGPRNYDLLVNAAGPHAEALLCQSGIESPYRLDLVRGSHLYLDRAPPPTGFLLESGENDARVVFVLPYQGRTLVGTTEQRQQLDAPVECSTAEQNYLLRVYNRYFAPACGPEDITGRFAGLRPLIRDRDNPTATSREYRVIRQDRLISVFGGKWTTARALGREVVQTVQRGVFPPTGPIVPP